MSSTLTQVCPAPRLAGPRRGLYPGANSTLLPAFKAPTLHYRIAVVSLSVAHSWKEGKLIERRDFLKRRQDLKWSGWNKSRVF